MFNLVFHLFYSVFYRLSTSSCCLILFKIPTLWITSCVLCQPWQLRQVLFSYEWSEGALLTGRACLKAYSCSIGFDRSLEFTFSAGNVSIIVGMIVSNDKWLLLIYSAARSVMADILMSYDREIVNFGD